MQEAEFKASHLTLDVSKYIFFSWMLTVCQLIYSNFSNIIHAESKNLLFVEVRANMTESNTAGS